MAKKKKKKKKKPGSAVASGGFTIEQEVPGWTKDSEDKRKQRLCFEQSSSAPNKPKKPRCERRGFVRSGAVLYLARPSQQLCRVGPEFGEGCVFVLACTGKCYTSARWPAFKMSGVRNSKACNVLDDNKNGAFGCIVSIAGGQHHLIVMTAWGGTYVLTAETSDGIFVDGLVGHRVVKTTASTIAVFVTEAGRVLTLDLMQLTTPGIMHVDTAVDRLCQKQDIVVVDAAPLGSSMIVMISGDEQVWVCRRSTNWTVLERVFVGVKSFSVRVTQVVCSSKHAFLIDGTNSIHTFNPQDGLSTKVPVCKYVYKGWQNDVSYIGSEYAIEGLSDDDVITHASARGSVLTLTTERGKLFMMYCGFQHTDLDDLSRCLSLRFKPPCPHRVPLTFDVEQCVFGEWMHDPPIFLEKYDADGKRAAELTVTLNILIDNGLSASRPHMKIPPDFWRIYAALSDDVRSYMVALGHGMSASPPYGLRYAAEKRLGCLVSQRQRRGYNHVAAKAISVRIVLGCADINASAQPDLARSLHAALIDVATRRKLYLFAGVRQAIAEAAKSHAVESADVSSLIDSILSTLPEYEHVPARVGVREWWIIQPSPPVDLL